MCRCGAAPPPLSAGASHRERLGQAWALARASMCCFSCQHPFALAAVMAAQVAVALAAAACMFAARAAEAGGGEQFMSRRAAPIEDASDPEWATAPLLGRDDGRDGVFEH